jgi:hypothetical protein
MPSRLTNSACAVTYMGSSARIPALSSAIQRVRNAVHCTRALLATINAVLVGPGFEADHRSGILDPQEAATAAGFDTTDPTLCAGFETK